MDKPAVSSVRGDLLSCFTASIASYMVSRGIDYELTIGSQLFTAIRINDAGALKLGFTHYHTPLCGDHVTHSLHLARRYADNPGEAVPHIIDECRRSGSVIVVGNTYHLPWLITHGQRHAPHWFLIDSVNELERTVHIVDRFEFLDEKGEQRSFEGWLGIDALADVARADSEPNPALEHRDRWAFGEEFDPSKSVLGGSQWFEALTPSVAHPITPEQCLNLLRGTQTAHGQSLRPPSLADPSWTCGLESLNALADYFAGHLDDPNLYTISDDLWVAARSRQLFARTLTRLGGELGRDSLSELGAFCDTEVASQWLALPRIMRYNVSCLERGRPPRALLVEIMRKIAELEEGLMVRLGEALV